MNKKDNPKASLDEEQLKLAQLRLACLRRNQEYRALWEDCQNFRSKYRRNRVLTPAMHKWEKEAKETLKKFGLKSFIDPETMKSLESVSLRDVKERKQKGTELLVYCSQYSILRDAVFPVDKINIKTLTRYGYTKYTNDDNVIILVIDLSADQKYIEATVKDYIISGKKRRKKARTSFKKIPVYLKMWDLKQEGKAPEEIAQILFENEWDAMLYILNQEDNLNAIDEAEKKKEALLKRVQTGCKNAEKLINGGYRDLR